MRRYSEIFDKVQENLNENSKEPQNVILIDDWNLPILKWPSGKIITGVREDKGQIRLPLDLMEGNFLE